MSEISDQSAPVAGALSPVGSSTPRTAQAGHYEAALAGEVEMLRHPAVSVAAGAMAVVVGTAAAGYRALERTPIVGWGIRRAVSELARRGDTFIVKGADQLKTFVVAIAAGMVELILDEIDLTALVKDRVDIDAIAADIDLDAVIDRIDLVSLANRVIDGVDLPAIIRDSTNTVTAEVMTDVRSQGERADDLVAGVVDRMLGRNRGQR